MSNLRGRIPPSLYRRHDEANPYDLPSSLQPREEAAPVVHTILPYHTPYLGLRARLSQVWFNRWTVLLALIIVRTILFVATMNDQLGSSKAQALAACTGVESMGSAMASMPHYMAAGVNKAAAHGIEAAVNGLEKTLLMGITIVSAIAVFAINFFIQTYVCLLSFAVTETADRVGNATEAIATFLNNTLESITGDIQNDMKTFQDALNKVTDKLNSIGNFFGSDTTIPTLTIPSLSELNNVRIPSSVTDAIENLRGLVPTFPQIDATIDSVIQTPFNLIQQNVNNSLGVYQFNTDVLPVPEKETLTFCSNSSTINNFFVDLHDTIFHVRNILIGVLVALAVLVMAPMAYREWWRYRSMRQRAYMLTAPGQSFDPVDIVQIASRPYSSTLGLKAASMFKSSRRQILVRWFFAYASTPACLFILSLGLAGLFSCLFQYIILKQVVSTTGELANEVGNYADLVVDHLVDASLAWANDANAVVIQTENEINNNVLGWVHQGALIANNTINEILDTVQNGTEQIFGGTPFEEGIQNIFFCFVELKARSIEKGLTWLYDNSNVSFPLFPNDTFSLGAATSVGPDAQSASSSFLADTGSEAADKITNVIVSLANKWNDQLVTETYISAALIGVWLFVCLLGLMRVLFAMMGRDKTRAEGGGRGLTGDGRQTFADKNHEHSPVPDNGVFPNFNEKSETSLHRGYTRDGSEEEIPAAIASPSRRGFQRAQGVPWTKSSHGEISS